MRKNSIGLFLTFGGIEWYVDDEIALVDMDGGHDCLGEGIEEGVAAIGVADFDEIASAKIGQGGNLADDLSRLQPRLKADQVGVIEVVGVIGLGQAAAIDIEFDAIERLGGIAISNALDVSNDYILVQAQFVDGDRQVRSIGVEGAVAADGQRVLGMRCDPDGALDAMRGADLAQQDTIGVLGGHGSSERSKVLLAGKARIGNCRATHRRLSVCRVTSDKETIRWPRF